MKTTHLHFFICLILLLSSSTMCQMIAWTICHPSYLHLHHPKIISLFTLQTWSKEWKMTHSLPVTRGSCPLIPISTLEQQCENDNDWKKQDILYLLHWKCMYENDFNTFIFLPIMILKILKILLPVFLWLMGYSLKLIN